MTLFQVYLAKDAFSRLGKLDFSATVAYRLMKYLKKVTAELEVIEAQRVKIILAVAHAEPGAEVRLTPDSPEHLAFVAQFQEYLATDSDLAPYPQDLESLLGALRGDQRIAPEDLAVLDPFFVTPAPATP